MRGASSHSEFYLEWVADIPYNFRKSPTDGLDMLPH